MIQGLSRAMLEQPVFTKERITSLDWVTYPILRFAESPKVTLVNVHPGDYATVEPDLAKGGLAVDVSKGNTNAFNNGWLLTGSGEPPTAAIARRDGERLLRRDGCPHPPRADELGERPRSVAAGRSQVAVEKSRRQASS